MARIRTIKPEMFSDEKLAPMAVLDRFVFIGLIAMADDAGRLIDNVKSIDGFVFPETEDTARESLGRLAAAGRIVRYTAESGQHLVQIAHWSRHQKVDHAAKYVLPPPSSSVAPTTSRDPRESLATVSRSDLGPVPTTDDLRPGTREGDARVPRAPVPSSEGETETTAPVEPPPTTPPAPSLALVKPETPPVGEPDPPTVQHAITPRRDRTPGRPGRTHDDVRASIERVFTDLREHAERRLRSDELRQFQAETVFAYWQVACGKRRALLDADRTRLLVKRLTENGGDVSELFYAIDGARRDPYVRDQRGCDLSFLLGTRARVEEFANKCAGYTREEPHPRAASLERALAGDAPAAAEEVAAHAS